MTPTSEERRKMAERMRGPFDVCECVGHTYINGTLYGMQVCARDELTLRDGMRRLADLIDPTCHVVTSGEWRGKPIGSACSVCHAPLYPSAAWAHGMRYCAQCGSRVVDDGD